MCGKFGFILLFLQLRQFSMQNQIAQNLTQTKELNQTVLRETPVASRETNFPIQIGKKFYRIEKELMVNWHQAQANCRQWGGSLFNIESSQEMNDLIEELIKGQGYWISANCLAKDRNFISISSGEPMPYTRWIQGEPNNLNNNEFCVEITTIGLNDLNCGILRKYICEAKILY